MTTLPEGFSIYNDLYNGCIETTLYLTPDSQPYEHSVPLGDLITSIVVGHSYDDGSMSDEGYHELEDLRESLVALIEGIDAVFDDDFGNGDICQDCMNEVSAQWPDTNLSSHYGIIGQVGNYWSDNMGKQT